MARPGSSTTTSTEFGTTAGKYQNLKVLNTSVKGPRIGSKQLEYYVVLLTASSSSSSTTCG
eukprot:2958188-Rhodomonas_salina.2